MKHQSVNLSQAAAATEEMVESLEQQLATLYEEKQLQASADWGDIATMRETIASLEAQLIGIELPTGVRLTVNASVHPEDLSRMMSVLSR